MIHFDEYQLDKTLATILTTIFIKQACNVSIDEEKVKEIYNFFKQMLS